MRLFGVDHELERARLQALRADPPGLAGRSGARRQVFGAALEQWDALLAASAAVVPAASPILLFYALSQAGRALCASRISGQPWRPVSHGLRIGDAANPLGDTQVIPDGGDNSSFAMFCRALGSDPLSETVRFGALWAANPAGLDSAPGLGDTEPRALLVGNSWMSYGMQAAGLMSFQLSGEVARDLGTGARWDAELRRRLSPYPGAADDVSITSVGISADSAPIIGVSWKRADGQPVPLHEIAPPVTSDTNAANYLRPALNPRGDTLPPLASWWAILLALSSVARYEPDRWRALLARDRSHAAIPIEQALARARSTLPWLLRDALDAEIN